MSTLKIEIDERLLKRLVLNYLKEEMGSLPIKEEDVKIEVKSKQNYRAEWEVAAFRAVVEKSF